MSLKSEESIPLFMKKDVIYCCGEEHTGHPGVYLKLDLKIHQATCPYCSRVFQNKTLMS